MKLSEKTLEINICCEISKLSHQRIIWFGLTQKQEAKAGFDVCTKLNRRLIIFQFKASSREIKYGINKARRFLAPHNQLDALRQRCHGLYRSIFYVFPLIGTTHEILSNPIIINNTWLLDVSLLSHLSQPLTKRGTLRKNGFHYIDVMPSLAIIHSESQEIKLINTAEVAKHLMEVEGINKIFQGNYERFEEFRQFFKQNSKGGIII